MNKMNKFAFVILLFFIALTVMALKSEMRSNYEYKEIKTEAIEDSGSIDYCMKVIEEVDSMQLICDTIFFNPFDEHEISYYFKGIYFDEKNRLRKYWRKEIVNDGAAECIDMSVYYDQNGDLVYIGIEDSYDCGSDAEYFHVHKGRIINYSYSGDCYCCDDEEESEEEEQEQEELVQDSGNDIIEDDLSAEEEQEQWLPAVGEPINKTGAWGFSVKRFIYADTLLKYLKEQNYNNEEFNDDN